MKKFSLLTVCALAAFASGIAAAEAPKCPIPGDWTFDTALSDEFDAPSFDHAKWWDFTPLWRGRREYINRAANVTQKDGKLELWAKRILKSEQEYEDRAQGFWPYTCGIVKSRRKVKYGYFEVRAKGTAAEVRNAFWLYDPLSDGINRPWSKYLSGSHSEEIDIYEFVGRFQDEAAKRPYKICSHVHRFKTPYVEGVVNADKTKLANAGGQYPVDWRPCDDYHVYGLLWTPEEIVWYVDGVETYRRANDYYHTDLHVMIDVEIAKWRGADPSKLDPSTLPAVHTIDYFRRWTAVEKPVRRSFLRKGDLWVMSGDSITHNDFYRQCVGAALDHFHPGHGVRIMNTAVWGQLVAEAEGQGVNLKPTVASIMLGMNDVIHRDYPPGFDFSEKAATYAAAVRRQVQDFKKNGADVILFTPTLTDETEHSYFNVAHTRAGLVAYGDALEKIAAEEGCTLLPIAADFEAFKAHIGRRETLIPDGVHPYGWGQYAIARGLIRHLRLDAPLAQKNVPRGSCDLNVVKVNDISIRRGGAFLSDGENPSIILTAPRDMKAIVRWSVAETGDRGEGEVNLSKGRPYTFTPVLAEGSLPGELGTVTRMILTVTPEDGLPRLAVADFARTKVYHLKDGVVRGEIKTDKPRREGSTVGTWEVRVDGSDLWMSGRMYASEWPDRPPSEKDIWMNSSRMNGVMALFDFRPLDRFAENRFDRDVNMINTYVLPEPWSVLTLPWINREPANCLFGHAERRPDGYEWRTGFRGRVNDYTRFDVSKLDVFGIYFIFADCENGRMCHYPVFGQLHGPARELRINPEHRLNQTAVFDRKGIIPGDETVTMGVFGL